MKISNVSSRSTDLSSPRAFTLIELLVVITIIALLAGLLMAALTGAQEKAHRVTCISNQRAIFDAVALYAADNDGYLPSATWGGTFAGDGWLYGSGKMNLSPLRKSYESGAVWKYLKNEKAYWCPADTDKALRAQRTQKLSSYSMNGAVNYYSGSNSPPTYRLAMFQPTGICMWEQEEGDPPPGFYFNDGGNKPSEVFFPTSPAERKRTNAKNRHNNGTPITCFDGHSEWVHIDDMLKLEARERPIFDSGNPRREVLRTWCEPKW